MHHATQRKGLAARMQAPAGQAVYGRTRRPALALLPGNVRSGGTSAPHLGVDSKLAAATDASKENAGSLGKPWVVHA
jgi:hypothetical protein